MLLDKLGRKVGRPLVRHAPETPLSERARLQCELDCWYTCRCQYPDIRFLTPGPADADIESR